MLGRGLGGGDLETLEKMGCSRGPPPATPRSTGCLGTGRLPGGSAPAGDGYILQRVTSSLKYLLHLFLVIAECQLFNEGHPGEEPLGQCARCALSALTVPEETRVGEAFSRMGFGPEWALFSLAPK